jgi:hypothetical protein
MSSHYRRVIGTAAPALVATVVAAALIPLVATPASAAGGTSSKPSRIGLYGQQDPTFDGVYRQGLAVLALTDHGAKVDSSAVRWLLRQQCDNGRFVSFRTKLRTSCTGTVSNSTAMAAMALSAVGRQARAKEAVQWLVSKQLPSGGWGFSTQFPADSNSTGLVAQALISVGRKPANIEKHGNSPFDFLRSVQLGCDDELSGRGALDYQANSPLVANDYATAQAAQALARTALPVAPQEGEPGLPALTCTTDKLTVNESAANASRYLGKRLNKNAGLIPGSDYGSTMNAVLALVASGHGANAAANAVAVLEDDARTFVLDGGDVLPAQAGLLTLVETATVGDPTDVDGLNLIRRIKNSITEAA